MSNFPIYPYALVKETAPQSMSSDALISRMIGDLAELQRRAAYDIEVETPVMTILGEVQVEMQQVRASRDPATFEALVNASGWIMPAEVA